MEIEKAIIVDLDGTLAHMNSKRGPFDWANVGVDDVDKVVRKMVRNFEDNYQVILVSGRDEICRKETEQWLHENGIFFTELHMRPIGDMRPDTEVKREIYDNFIWRKYDVVLVFDDRPKVIRMWRDLGLRVIDVGNGIEF